MNIFLEKKKKKDFRKDFGIVSESLRHVSINAKCSLVKNTLNNVKDNTEMLINTNTIAYSRERSREFISIF